MPTARTNSAARKPQDRKPKQKKPVTEVEDFEFKPTGPAEAFTITVEEISEVVTPGFFRRHRNSSDQELTFVTIEALGREDILDVIDNSWRDFTRFGELFGQFVQDVMELQMGESEAS